LSVLVSPNSHVPHWSESVVLQTNPIPISHIRKSFGVLEPFLTEDVFRVLLESGRKGISRVRWNTLSEMTWTRKYFRKSVQIGHPFITSLEWYFDSGVVPYIYFNGLKAS
jgi:hypothetical protein